MDVVLFVAVFALAFAVRLVYLFQIEAIPFFYNLLSDSRIYDEWARRIAAGDWLGRGIFYQAPLYPYFLALLETIFGRDLWSIRLVQIILGSASCGLLFLTGKLFFSRAAGVAAGLILSLYAPAIFFDALIQKPVLDLFLVSLLLLLLGGALARPAWKRWITVGIVLALLALSRENALVWLVLVPLWIWFYPAGQPPRARLKWVAVLLAGSMLVLFPVGLRNLRVGGEFTLTTAQLGANFFIGNNPAADGTYAPFRPGRASPQYEQQDATELAEQALGRSLTPGEVSGYWLKRAWDYIRSQPLDWLRLMGRKWLVVWNVRELEDADDFYLYQEWSWLLGFLGWVNHFGLLAPLAAMGIVLTWRQWRKLWLLYLLLIGFASSVALFYIFARYRFPMVPLLALFAGAAVMEAWRLYRERRLRAGLACGVVLLLSGALVYWPLVGRSGPSAAGYYNLGSALAMQGRLAEAVESYQQALKVQPDYSMPHYSLGRIFAEQGKLDQATFHYQEAVKIDPDFAEAHNNLGNVLARQGDLDGAIKHFREALRIRPDLFQSHENLARALALQGNADEAIRHHQEALRLKKAGGVASVSP